MRPQFCPISFFIVLLLHGVLIQSLVVRAPLSRAPAGRIEFFARACTTMRDRRAARAIPGGPINKVKTLGALQKKLKVGIMEIGAAIDGAWCLPSVQLHTQLVEFCVCSTG